MSPVTMDPESKSNVNSLAIPPTTMKGDLSAFVSMNNAAAVGLPAGGAPTPIYGSQQLQNQGSQQQRFDEESHISVIKVCYSIVYAQRKRLTKISA